MLTNLFLVLLPFDQLGVSYYLSIASVLALLMFAQCWRRVIDGIARTPMVWIGAAVIMVSPLAYGGAANDILRCAREAVFLLLLVGAIRGIEATKPPPKELVSQRMLFGLIAAFTLLTMMQTLLLSRGMKLAIPARFYIMGSGTIVDAIKLRFSYGNLRAAATYSEPSYFGFVLLALAMAAVPFAGSRMGKAMIGMIIVSGLLSRSLSLLIAGSLLLFVPTIIGRARSGSRFQALAAPLLVAIPVLLLTKASDMLSRLMSASSLQTADVSTTNRIVAPLAALPRFLLDHPLGVPDSGVLREVYAYIPRGVRPPFDRFSLDNALLNFFFSHGFFGFFIIAVIVLASRDLRVRIFLFCCMSFNGSYLRVDLVAMMIFAVLIYHHHDRRIAGQTPRRSVAPRGFRRNLPAVSSGTFQ